MRASALAGTVAGMVTNQNTPRPTTAASNASNDKLAQHRRSPFSSVSSQTRPARKAKGRRVHRTAALQRIIRVKRISSASCDRSGGSRRSSCRPRRTDALKLSRSFDRLRAALESCDELGELGLEVGHVLPDRRQRRGVAAGLGVVGEQVRQLLAGRRRRPRRSSCALAWSNGACPSAISPPILVCAPIVLHQRLAGRDRVGLGDNGGDAERNGGTASTVRIIRVLPLMAGCSGYSGQPRTQFDIPQRKLSGRAGHGSRSRELSMTLRKTRESAHAFAAAYSAGCGAGAGLPRGAYRDPAADHVEHRREDQAESGHADHAGEHRGAERLAQLRAGADAPTPSAITPKMKASEVIRIGRSRSRAASTAASKRSRP